MEATEGNGGIEAMNEKTLRSKTVFDGRLLKLDCLDVELDSGVRAEREIVRHPGAAVVLPQLPDGRFVFVRQFRKPVERELIEAVAGVLEHGEDPADCAARELMEETGFKSNELHKLGVAYPSPGYTDEELHFFYAQLSCARGSPSPEDDEKLDVVYFSVEDFEKMILKGEIVDAKTVVAWQLWKSRIQKEKR